MILPGESGTGKGRHQRRDNITVSPSHQKLSQGCEDNFNDGKLDRVGRRLAPTSSNARKHSHGNEELE
jgi:hypothetical protein